MPRLSSIIPCRKNHHSFFCVTPTPLFFFCPSHTLFLPYILRFHTPFFTLHSSLVILSLISHLQHTRKPKAILQYTFSLQLPLPPPFTLLGQLLFSSSLENTPTLPSSLCTHTSYPGGSHPREFNFAPPPRAALNHPRKKKQATSATPPSHHTTPNNGPPKAVRFYQGDADLGKPSIPA